MFMLLIVSFIYWPCFSPNRLQISVQLSVQVHAVIVCLFFFPPNNVFLLIAYRVLIPVNIHHITSRTSTFIMLVLGEAVIALLTPTFKGAKNHYFFAIFGVLIIFIYTFLYFDMQPKQHEQNALTLGRFSGVAWLALHPLLAFTMFGE